jgi:hypothetical protein
MGVTGVLQHFSDRQSRDPLVSLVLNFYANGARRYTVTDCLKCELSCTADRFGPGRGSVLASGAFFVSDEAVDIVNVKVE